jgi:predicted DNA binding CopG/RHH family protein
MTTTSRTKPSGRPAGAGWSGKYQVDTNVELSAEESAEVERQVAQADSERTEVSTTLRWGRAQLDIVRRAARLAGIPYQTYLKEVVIRGALMDLRIAHEAGVDVPPESNR